ncbi:SIMPL domain-containing protein [Yinghuangia seranimata]|uniref:SIMPL domain-containing protein n=1 Tax=Yinghuangia seranimata TaxID=408067 RepID=UPI00248CECE4|nr:SIMPL domain-containing protein [Yinghuangia seranimata]MDI2125613.1 SIMPL domain-containing protein [Yinghuangia seranimata]
MRTGQIETPWGASVFGAATVEAAPDLARIRVAVRQTRSEAPEAFAATRSHVNRVREVLRGHGVADTDVAVSRIQVTTEWQYLDNRREFAGYECAAGFTVRLRDLDRLEAVLVDVIDAGANDVQQVEFDAADRDALRTQARRDAVAAARAKAELYAEAAGVRVGRVLHIQDTEDADAEVVYKGGISIRAGGGGGGRPGDLAPGEVSVSAAVLVGFALEA